MTEKKYHTNKDGVTRECEAKDHCPLKDMDGNLVKHYDTQAEAEAAYEQMMEQVVPLTATLTKEDTPDQPEVSELPEEQNILQVDMSAMKKLEQEELEKVFANDPDLKAMSIKQEKLLKKAVENRQQLSEAEYKEREEYIEGVTKPLEDFYKIHTEDPDDPESSYTDERQDLHEEIIKTFFNKYRHVKRERKIVVAGGLPGAGKSTVLAEKLGIDENDYATLNPDDIKEAMAERGMIPDIRGLTPMEASPIIHEEASYITNILQARLSKLGVNIIFDTTLSTTDSAERKIGRLEKHGYTRHETEGFLVDITPDTAISRTKSRYREGMDGYIASGGKTIGGRYLPESLIKKQRTDDSSIYDSKNAENFVKMVEDGWISKPKVFDNNGKKPRKIYYEDFIK